MIYPEGYMHTRITRKDNLVESKRPNLEDLYQKIL